MARTARGQGGARVALGLVSGAPRCAVGDVACRPSVVSVQAWNAAGAHVVLGLQSDRFVKAAEKLAADWERPPTLVECDVRSDESIERAMAAVQAECGPGLHALCHSIAFAPASAMGVPFHTLSRKDFLAAHDISAYSFLALTRAALPALRHAAATDGGASVMCLTYAGSTRAVPSYGVMGAAKASLEASTRYLAADLGQDRIRVNALSAGPINTLAARGVPGFLVRGATVPRLLLPLAVELCAPGRGPRRRIGLGKSACCARARHSHPSRRTTPRRSCTTGRAGCSSCPTPSPSMMSGTWPHSLHHQQVQP